MKKTITNDGWSRELKGSVWCFQDLLYYARSGEMLGLNFIGPDCVVELWTLLGVTKLYYSTRIKSSSVEDAPVSMPVEPARMEGAVTSLYIRMQGAIEQIKGMGHPSSLMSDDEVKVLLGGVTVLQYKRRDAINLLTLASESLLEFMFMLRCNPIE